MKRSPPLDFIVPVWGESYVATFLDYCLPAQLSSGNIPALGRSGEDSYCIFTTHSDCGRIQASAAFRALQSAIAVKVELIDEALFLANTAGSGAKYTVKSNCYRQALQSARGRDAAVMPLNADIVLANGFVRTVKDLLSQGKRVIEVVGPRGLRDPIGQTLLSNYRSKDGSITIAPLELSALWLRHIHPLLRMHFVEGPDGAPFHPSHLYWAVGEDGILARCYHLYPIVVYPKSASIDFSTTIDDDLVENLGLRADERFVAQDSREMFCCELSPPHQYVGNMARRGDLDRYVAFYGSYGGRNLVNLRKEIIIAGVSNLDARWDLRRQQSKLFVRRLLKLHRGVRYRRFLRTMREQAVSVLGKLTSALRKTIPGPLRAVLRRVRAVIARSNNSK